MREKNVVILVGKKEGDLFTGEKDFFRALSISISQKGGNCFIFPYDQTSNNQAFYSYRIDENRWEKEGYRTATVVYNRYPYREGARKEALLPFLHYLNTNNIPFFNDAFFNKVKIHDRLMNHPFLRHYYPKTIRIKKKEQLSNFLSVYKDAYLKDSHGAQGRGIWRIKMEEATFSLYTQKRKITSLPLSVLFHHIKPLLNERQLLLQKTIDAARVDGMIYDFRILMMKHDKRWENVGMGVRVATHRGYTTHVPHGGSILPIQLAPIYPPTTYVEKIGEALGLMLEKHYSNIKEFSFDLIPDNKGTFWIVDVNSKPMSFDEAHIQKKRIHLLSNILMSYS